MSKDKVSQSMAAMDSMSPEHLRLLMLNKLPNIDLKNNVNESAKQVNAEMVNKKPQAKTKK